MVARLVLAGDDGALLTLPALAPLVAFCLGRRTLDALKRAVALEVRQRPPGTPHLTHRLAALRAHHHEVADVQLEILGGQVVLGLGHLA